MSRLLSGFGFTASSRGLSGSGEGVDWTRVADAELARAAQADPQERSGREAFVEIVRRHQTAVCAVAWSVTGRVGLTDDIAQETFFKAWKQIGTLRDPARLKPWLTKIAHDCAVDALRRERRQLPGRSGFPGVGSGSGTGSGSDAGSGLDCGLGCGSDAGQGYAEAAPSLDAPPDKAAADAEEEALVWSALAALPETWRTPLVLFYREGKSVTAVADSLGLSEDAVKQRLSRGRQALRSAVESRIETVLGRVQPSALLVVTVAAGLGLFSKSSALAAGIGSGAIAAGSAVTGSTAGVAAGGVAGGAAGGVAGGAAGVFGFMTASSWLAAALSLAAFLPLGWRAHGPAAGDGSGGDGKAAAVVPVSGLDADDPFAAYPDSQLLAAWRRLHAEHGSDAAAMPVIHALIQAEPDAFRRRALGIALLAEWAAVDPEGGFQKLWSEAKNTDQSTQFLREWLKRDPGAAAARLLASLPGAETLAVACAGDFAALAPEQFIAVVTALPSAAQPGEAFVYAQVYPNRTALGEAFETWARLNPKAAADALPMLNGQLLSEAQVSVAALMAAKDPAGALAWARALKIAANDGARMSAPVAAVMALWAGANPAAAMATIGSNPGDQERAGWVLETLASRDVEAAIRFRTEHDAQFNNDSWKVFYGPLTRQLEADPAATLTLLKNQPPAIRDRLAETLDVSALNPASSRTAWEWMLTEKPEGMAATLCGKLVAAAVESDPANGWRKWKDLPPEWQATVCRDGGNLAYLTGQLGAGQLDELLGSISGQARDVLLAAAFDNRAEDPVPDLTLWRSRLDELPPDARPKAAGKFACSLVYTDPMLAVSYADSTPEGPIRAQAYFDLVDRWAYSHSLEASQWVDQLPPGSGRDSAAAALIGRLNYRDPSAMDWINAIAGDDVRMQALTKLMDNALYAGPGSGAALLASPVLRSQDREALLLARPQLKVNPAK